MALGFLCPTRSCGPREANWRRSESCRRTRATHQNLICAVDFLRFFLRESLQFWSERRHLVGMVLRDLLSVCSAQFVFRYVGVYAEDSTSRGHLIIYDRSNQGEL